MDNDCGFMIILFAALLLAAPAVLCQGDGSSATKNNAIGDAYEVKFDQPAEDSISSVGEVDYYKFYIDTSGIAQIKVDGVPDEMLTEISLFNKNNEVAGYLAAANPGDPVTLERDLLGPGWFYIKIKDNAGKAHSSSYSMAVSFAPAPDKYEPNNGRGDATEIKPSEAVSAYICPVGDLDYYRFYADASGIASIKVDGIPDKMITEISLFNKDNEVAGYLAAANPGDPATLEKDLLGPGWFYIKIKDNAGKAYSEPYSLTLSLDSAPDKYEPNNGLGDATALDLGQTVSAYICPASDTDYYRINMTGPGMLALKVSDVPKSMVPAISLWNANADTIGSMAATNPGDSVTLEKGVSDPGIYYVQVSDSAGKAHSEPYTLVITTKSEAAGSE